MYDENLQEILGKKIEQNTKQKMPLLGVFVLMPLGWFAQRANQTTTRYAGVGKKLYKKIPLSSTIRLFKS